MNKTIIAITLATLATLSPSAAHAENDAPSAGTYSVRFIEDTWGRGDALGCWDFTGGCWASSLGDFNDEMSSYIICNNTGSTRTFRVQLYADANYNQRFEYALIAVDDDSCVLRNTLRNDVASSLKVDPL